MWIVRRALRRPCTVAVMGFLVLPMGFLSIQLMAVYIFPEIDVPVVAVIWNYAGLAPEDMERRAATRCERAISSNVNGVWRIESQSIQDAGSRIQAVRGLGAGTRVILNPSPGLRDGERVPVAE